jgi:hypothetical protein
VGLAWFHVYGHAAHEDFTEFVDRNLDFFGNIICSANHTFIYDINMIRCNVKAQK